MTTVEAAEQLAKKFGIPLENRKDFRGEITFTLEHNQLRDVCRYCRDEMSFEMLIDISSVDNFGEEPRFEIVYEMYSLTTGVHLRLKLLVSEDNAEVPTVNDIWRTADWHEREIFDMMGIKFTDHPDLRRILMWDGYPYHPLRKDFPLEGKPSLVPDVAFTGQAPLAGGPFVGPAEEKTRANAEPRANKRNLWDETSDNAAGQNSDIHKPRESGR